MNLALTSVGIVISSVLALVIDSVITSPDTRNMVIVGTSGFVFILLCANYFSSLKFIDRFGKTALFFACSLLIQLLVLILGGVKSPFFIFLHLFLIGASFLFGTIVSLIFLVSSMLALILQISINNEINSLFIEDPITSLFVLASYAAIIPLVYLLSGSYAKKDQLSKALTQQISLDETILQGVEEMLLVTDTSLHVISVNDAVEKILNKSNIEILEEPIFSIIFLKNSEGKVLSNEDIKIDDIIRDKKIIELPDLLFLPLNGEATQMITLKISPVLDLEGNVDQLCLFIAHSSKGKKAEGTENTKLEQAHLMYEARVEDLKQRLIASGMGDLHLRFLLTNKLHEDILLAESIENHGIKSQKVRFDVARSCQEIVKRAKEYTKLFKADTSLQFSNFSNEDITPLLPPDHKEEILPENFTGPFFTVRGDMKRVADIVKRLIALGVLLGHNNHASGIKVVLERGNREQVYVHVHAKSPLLTEIEQKNLFLPYYPSLTAKTGLSLGSGLEGYITKMLADHLDVPLTCQYVLQSEELVFTLRFTRDSNTLS